ncbi:MAG: hypothetical protein ACYC5N_07410, partial [Endomicrobiales bacterium]
MLHEMKALLAGRMVSSAAHFFNWIAGLTFTKVVSLMTVVCFLLSFVFGQGVASVLDTRREAEKINRIADGFVVPSSAGRITEAGFYGGKKVVVAIQDLHCHGEVQKNIARILSLLDDTYHLRQVYLEGSSGRVDTAWLADIDDKDLRQKLLDSLIDEGKLTGAEYYSAASGRTDCVVGLENGRLYDENVLRLNRILSQRGEIDGALNDFSRDLEALKGRYYNSRQQRMESLVSRYRSGAIGAVKYYTLLKGYSEKLGIDFDEYRNVSQFMEMARLEKDLRYRRISAELQELMVLLKQQLPYSAYRLMLSKSSDASRPDELYAFLMQAVRDYRLDLASRLPNAARFFDYLRLNQGINPVGLINEEKRLYGEIMEGLASDQSGRDVAFIADFFRYFGDYFGNKISAEDYAYLAAHHSRFQLLWTKYTDNEKTASLDRYYSVVNDYYRVNLERNHWFIRNMLGKASRTPAPVAVSPYDDPVRETVASLKDAEEVVVTVTGGFHTPGLVQLLKKEKVSYLVVTPNVTSGTELSETAYLARILLQGKIASQTLGPKAVLNTAIDPQLPMNQQLLFLTGTLLQSLKENAGAKDVEKWMNFFLQEWNKERNKLEGNEKLGSIEFKIGKIEGDKESPLSFSIVIRSAGSDAVPRVRNYVLENRVIREIESGDASEVASMQAAKQPGRIGAWLNTFGRAAYGRLFLVANVNIAQRFFGPSAAYNIFFNSRLPAWMGASSLTLLAALAVTSFVGPVVVVPLLAALAVVYPLVNVFVHARLYENVFEAKGTPKQRLLFGLKAGLLSAVFFIPLALLAASPARIAGGGVAFAGIVTGGNTDNDGKNEPKSGTIEELRKVVESLNLKTPLKESDLIYFASHYDQLKKPRGKTKLVMGRDFFPSALMTREEREQLLGAAEYTDLL